jgi:C4-dicarboxylate transporter DctQ subunit
MFVRLLHQAEETIIALLLVCMTLLVFADVVMRFGFGTGVLWSQELTLHMSAWFVLFGIAYGLRVGSHIGVDAFVKLFSPLVQRLISTVAVLLSLFYCALFLIGSWVYLEKMKMIGIELEDLPIPTWVAHGMLLVGFVMFSIRLLELLWAIARGHATGFRHSDEAKESMRLAAEISEKGPRS